MTVLAEVRRENLSPVECNHVHCKAESTKLLYIGGDAAEATTRECDAHVADALDKWGRDR